MTLKVGVPRPKIEMYGLVRDKNGKPKVDNPQNLHPEQVKMLTPEERVELGLPAGDPQ